MRVLIVEDDFMSRKILHKFLSTYGECDFAVDGMKALEAFVLAWRENRPYDLICLDIMMPNANGFEFLNSIRDIENEMDIHYPAGAKVIMTTALDDPGSVFKAMYKGGAVSYLVKPVTKKKLLDEVKNLGLIDRLHCG